MLVDSLANLSHRTKYCIFQARKTPITLPRYAPGWVHQNPPVRLHMTYRPLLDDGNVLAPVNLVCCKRATQFRKNDCNATQS